MDELDFQNKLFAMELAVNEYNSICKILHNIISKHNKDQLPELLQSSISLSDKSDINFYHDKLKMDLNIMTSYFQQLYKIVLDTDLINQLDNGELKDVYDKIDKAKTNIASAVIRMRE